jgi:phospholipid transport system transporter-binding protein
MATRRIDGDLTIASAPRLLAESGAWFGESLTLDLAGVSRSDSGGAALMLEWTRRARRAGIELAFINVPGQLSAMLEFCGVRTIVAVPD